MYRHRLFVSCLILMAFAQAQSSTFTANFSHVTGEVGFATRAFQASDSSLSLVPSSKLAQWYATDGTRNIVLQLPVPLRGCKINFNLFDTKNTCRLAIGLRGKMHFASSGSVQVQTTATQAKLSASLRFKLRNGAGFDLLVSASSPLPTQAKP